MRLLSAVSILILGAGAALADTAATRDSALNAWVTCSREAAAAAPADLAPAAAVAHAFATCADAEASLKAVLPERAAVKARDGTPIGAIGADESLEMLRGEIANLILMERALARQGSGARD